MRIALYQPEIPQNTGTILRLAACMGIGVDIIEPCGFIWSHPNFKRAVMDYLPHVDVRRFCDVQEFLETYVTENFSTDGNLAALSMPENFVKKPEQRIIACIVSGGTSVYDFRFHPTDTILFGRESDGLPEHLTEALETIFIPMPGKLRSLNLATAVSFVAGVAFGTELLS